MLLSLTAFKLYIIACLTFPFTSTDALFIKFFQHPFYLLPNTSSPLFQVPYCPRMLFYVFENPPASLVFLLSVTSNIHLLPLFGTPILSCWLTFIPVLYRLYLQLSRFPLATSYSHCTSDHSTTCKHHNLFSYMSCTTLTYSTLSLQTLLYNTTVHLSNALVHRGYPPQSQSIYCIYTLYYLYSCVLSSVL